MKLLRRYPDDIRGSELADLYFMTEQWDKAIEQYRIYVQNQEISYFPYRGASSSYEAKGLYDRASEILKNYLHDISDHHSVHRLLAFAYLCQGNFDLALDEAEILEPWDTEINGNIYNAWTNWTKRTNKKHAIIFS